MIKHIQNVFVSFSGKPDAIEEPEDSNIKIIIDTSGTHQELDTSAKTKNSSKKNKSFNKSKLSESAVGIDCTGW